MPWALGYHCPLYARAAPSRARTAPVGARPEERCGGYGRWEEETGVQDRQAHRDGARVPRRGRGGAGVGLLGDALHAHGVHRVRGRPGAGQGCPGPDSPGRRVLHVARRRGRHALPHRQPRLARLQGAPPFDGRRGERGRRCRRRRGYPHQPAARRLHLRHVRPCHLQACQLQPQHFQGGAQDGRHVRRHRGHGRPQARDAPGGRPAQGRRRLQGPRRAPGEGRGARGPSGQRQDALRQGTRPGGRRELHRHQGRRLPERLHVAGRPQDPLPLQEGRQAPPLHRLHRRVRQHRRAPQLRGHGHRQGEQPHHHRDAQRDGRLHLQGRHPRGGGHQLLPFARPCPRAPWKV